MKKKRTQPPTGLNTDPVYMAERGRKGRAASPWGKKPMIVSDRAQRIFKKNARPTT